MISSSPDQRNVFPRWLPFRLASSENLIVEATDRPWAPNSSSLHQFEYLKFEWRQERSLAIASDFLGSALVLEKWNDVDVQIAAEDLLRTTASQWAVPRSIAAWILGSRAVPSLQGSAAEQIRRIRGVVRDYPQDALAWLDLGYFYTLLGLVAKAQRCVSVAASLGGRNPFVVRSVARFFVHIDDLEQGLYHLKRNPAVRRDPLILAPAA